MESVSNAAKILESNFGLSAGLAQATAWVAVLLTAWAAIRVLSSLLGGGSRRKRQRGNLLLLLGQCGAGKTALFFQLRDSTKVRTVSSQKANRDKLKISDKDGEIGTIETVDCPGHLRLREQAAGLLKDARCIVYVLDAEDKQRLKDVAEHLYELFTHPDILELHLPILLACNKAETSSARPEKFILSEIEREIEAMRLSRGATLEGQDQADSYLGVEGEKFKLLEHAPCSVALARISASPRDPAQPQLGPVYEFLRQEFS